MPTRKRRNARGLRDTAKSLVDEILKISVTKLKIDDLKETIDKKVLLTEPLRSLFVKDICNFTRMV